MRLINKDELLEEAKKKSYSRSSLKFIEDQEEVEAITINWIMKYCYEKQEQYSITRGGFWLLWQMEVKKMIENWREENE